MTITPLRDPMATAVLLTKLFDRASDGRLEVARLTDEEVSLLDGPGSDQVAPFPWLSALDPAQQETAREVAARGLVARGLAVLLPADGPDDGLSIAVDDDVYAALAARRASTAIVVAERRTPDGSQTRVLYVEADLGIVEEDVSPGGLHVFSAGSAASAFDALAAFVDPVGSRGRQDGPVQQLDLSPTGPGLDALSTVEDPGWVSVVAAVVPGADGPQEHRLTVITSSRVVRLVRPVAGQPKATLQEVGAKTLRASLEELLAGDGWVSGSPAT